MKQDKRIEKIESNLTPKQAAMVWMKETNSQANIMEYIKVARGVPEALRPIPRLTEQVARAVREAMAGKPKETIKAAERRAKRDVVFLIKLHNQVNSYFMTEERVLNVIFAALEGELRAID